MADDEHVWVVGEDVIHEASGRSGQVMALMPQYMSVKWEDGSIESYALPTIPADARRTTPTD